MRMKKWICLLLTALFVLSVTWAQASILVGYITIDGERRPIYKEGDWWYYQVGDSATIYQYSGKQKDIVIPAELDGLPVQGATSWAVPTGVVSVVIPGSFRVIPDRMLYNRKSLENVTLEEGVEATGASLCWSCPKLSSVTFPSTLKEIGSGAFYNCDSLTQLALTGNGLSIGAYAFNDCDGLLLVSISKGVSAVGDGAFYSCDALMTVRMGANVRTIGDEAFADCPALTDMQIGSGVTSIGAWAFSGDGLTEFHLPASLSSIGTHAFDTDGLDNLDIPDNVTSMDLPVVSNGTVMIVGENTPPHRMILSAQLLNYRLRGQAAFVPGTGQEAVTVTEKIDDIVATVIRTGMSDYEKALALHDWLTANAQYDVTRSQVDTYEPEGVLLRGAGVCMSYTSAYAMLLDKVGIPNTCEYGDDHVWNLVCLDGTWVHVDVTWNDPLSATQGKKLESKAKSGRETHTYFGLTNEALIGVNSHECYEQPHIATSCHYSYAWKNGMLTAHVNAVMSEINRQLAAGNTSFTFVPSTFGTNEARNKYGINERLSLAAVREQTFTAKGIEYTVTLSYDSATRALTVTAAPCILPRTQVDLGTLTVNPGDDFRIPVEAVWMSEDTAVATAEANGTVHPVNTGAVQLVGLTDTEEYFLTLSVHSLSSLAIRFAEVDEDSFVGTAAQRVTVEAGVRSIGAGSFASMPNLRVAYFTGETRVGENCFADCPDVVIFAPEGSPAANYAEAHGIQWVPLP